MDPNPTSFPILSYVMSKLPQLALSKSSTTATDFVPDIEQPYHPSASYPVDQNPIFDQMPRISDPKVLATMTSAISEVAQTRSVLRTLGERPDHETVDNAKSKLSEIESNLAKQLEEIVLSPRPSDIDRIQFRSHLADKENECRKMAEKDKQIYKAIIQLDEMHEAYQKLLRESEEKLVGVYKTASDEVNDASGEVVVEEEESVNEEVVGILQEASGRGLLERVDLSGKSLKFLPEAFGHIRGLVSLNLSNNQLEASLVYYLF